MKRPISGAVLSCLSIFLLFFVSCVPQETETEIEPVVEPVAPVEKVEKQVQLPVQYQRPSYKVSPGNSDSLDEVIDDVAIKVGASIRSTQGPQPLWDILKRVAALKKMSVSWASDVDQHILVDVDINANDDFYDAIANLLRQVDYYHEIDGSTIIVKYKETRQFHIAMPNVKSTYETTAGGNLLGGSTGSDVDRSDNIQGSISLVSKGNEFDIWKNIKLNLDTIMDKWSIRREMEDVGALLKDEDAAEKARSYGTTAEVDTGDDKDFVENKKSSLKDKKAGFGYYIIDQHLGLISVTAPRPILQKVDEYLTSLKKQIYKQISIEAKIIEVRLTDNSSIGLNWNQLLKSLSMVGGNVASFGKYRTDDTNKSYNDSDSRNRQSDDFRTLNTDVDGLTTTTRALTSASTSIASSGATAATFITNGVSEALGATVSLASFTFDTFINAVKEQGQTTILSNPKLSVLNGQPALITVGRNVTYIDNISVDVDSSGLASTRTYTAETARILSGVGMSLIANILDDNEIIMTLVPVTSELNEPIEYRDVGEGEVGLPVINVREMSTTVKVKDGEMLVIGGLIGSYDGSDGTFVPGTSNIPFFKYLFGYEEKVLEKRELIILLKPRIL